MATRIGGSFAPPLTAEKLKEYGKLIDGLDKKDILGDALSILLKCCNTWWKLPESTTPSKPHPSGLGNIVALSAENATALWELIPWSHELEAFGTAFDAIDPIKDKSLRDMAYHLLWHVQELNLDREPTTTDKL